MALNVQITNLFSRVIRRNFVAGKTGPDVIRGGGGSGGKRKITSPSAMAASQKQQQGNALQQFGRWIWDRGTGLTGWAWSKVSKAVSWSASAIWGNILVPGAQALWRFDWNQTDEEMRANLESRAVGLAGLWGGAVGQAVGGMVAIGIGYGISLVLPVIGGAALARMIAAGTAKQLAEEVGPSVNNAVNETVKLIAQWQATEAYIDIRSKIKSAPIEQLQSIFGKDAGTWLKEKWGGKGGPNMSFAAQTERAVEAIPNKYVRAFVESFLEEAWESFVETGFIIAGEIDNAYSQQKLQNQQMLGPERTVVIEPDRRVSDEKIVFQNVPEKLLIPAVQTTLNTHRLIANRDVGLVVGMPVEDYARAKPQSLRLVITMLSVKQPPFQRKGKAPQRAVITVPDVKVSAMDWARIKLACGGSNGYTYGRFRATANLDNGRQMVVYGGSEGEAENRMSALLSLTKATLQTLSITEEKKAGERLRKPKLYKDSIQLYPAYCTIINREEILDPARGDAALGQPNYRDRKGRIDLWPLSEPKDADEVIRRLLTKG